MRAQVAIGLCLAAASWASAGGLDTLEELGRTLRSHSAWCARYDQFYLPAGMSAGDEAHGVVWVAWPDRARFSTTAPVAREMALEGRRVRLVDGELGSCDDHVVSDDEWARVPLAVLLDPRGAVERFTIVDEPSGRLVLVPRDGGGVARVELLLGTDGLPAEVVVVDVQGARNRLLFAGWEGPCGPPGGRWLPEPPAGVTCADDLGAE